MQPVLVRTDKSACTGFLLPSLQLSLLVPPPAPAPSPALPPAPSPCRHKYCRIYLCRLHLQFAIAHKLQAPLPLSPSFSLLFPPFPPSSYQLRPTVLSLQLGQLTLLPGSYWAAGSAWLNGCTRCRLTRAPPWPNPPPPRSFPTTSASAAHCFSCVQGCLDDDYHVTCHHSMLL